MTHKHASDSDLSYDLYLPILEGNPDHARIKAMLERHVGELSAQVKGDRQLLADIYASLGDAFFNDIDALDDTDIPVPLPALGDGDEPGPIQSDGLYDGEPVAMARGVPEFHGAWDLANYFKRTPEGMKLHVLETGTDVDGTGQVDWRDLPDGIAALADTLAQIESRFDDLMSCTSLTLHPCRGAWEADAGLAETGKISSTVVFVDQHLYAGHVWSPLVKCYLRNCINGLDLKGMDDLAAVCNRLPANVSAMIRAELGELPSEFGAFMSGLKSRLSDGILLTDLRHLVKSFGIERYNIAPKTWIDGLCAQGYLTAGKQHGRSVYHLGEQGWPT